MPYTMYSQPPQMVPPFTTDLDRQEQAIREKNIAQIERERQEQEMRERLRRQFEAMLASGWYMQ
jgi:hypothetical protein